MIKDVSGNYIYKKKILLLYDYRYLCVAKDSFIYVSFCLASSSRVTEPYQRGRQSVSGHQQRLQLHRGKESARPQEII